MESCFIFIDMFSNIMKLLFILTAYSPIILIIGVVEVFNIFSDGNSIVLIEHWKELFNRINLIFLFILLFVLCFFLIKIAEKKLTIHKIEIDSIDSVDLNILPLIITYFLPCVELLKKGELYIYIWSIVIIIAVFIAKRSHFYNPILMLYGYRYYKVNTKAKVSYTIISKKEMKDTKKVNRYSQLTDYVILNQS